MLYTMSHVLQSSYVGQTYCGSIPPHVLVNVANHVTGLECHRNDIPQWCTGHANPKGIMM